MASEPNWDVWRHIDVAPLWQLVALLAGLDPDAMRVELDLGGGPVWRGANEKFSPLLRIALSSVEARKLQVQGYGLQVPGYGLEPWARRVLMPEFLRWAASKGLPIPPALILAEGTGTTAASASAATSIAGIDGLRDLIKELGGPVLGDEAAVRTFAKSAGIVRDGDNPKRTKRTWSRADVEPLLKAAIEIWRQRQTK